MPYTKGERVLRFRGSYWFVETRDKPGRSDITIGRFSKEEDALLDAAAPDTAEALQELISFLIHDGLITNNRLVPIINRGTKALKEAHNAIH